MLSWPWDDDTHGSGHCLSRELSVPQLFIVLHPYLRSRTNQADPFTTNFLVDAAQVSRCVTRQEPADSPHKQSRNGDCEN